MTICFEPYAGTLGVYNREELLEVIHQAGYEGLELPVDENFVDFSSKKDLEYVKKLIDSYGLKVPSVCGMYPAHRQITHPLYIDRAQNYIRDCMKVAELFGAYCIVVWPNIPEGVPIKEAKATAKANLQVLVDKAEEKNMVLALEFEKRCLLDNYREALEFVAQTDNRLGIVCDTYHLYNDRADPRDAVLALGRKITIVHVSDSDRLPPGKGKFGYARFFAALKEIAYQGPLSLQYHVEDLSSLKESCEFVKSLLT